MAKQIHDVIYIPGIGDTKTTLQELVVNTWRFYGVRSWTVAMRWADQSETYDQKFTRLMNFIDEKLAAGHKVSLVGVSAGASAVVNAYVARKDQISGVVTICGKMNRPEAIGQYYRKHVPAFVESDYLVPQNLELLGAEQRSRFLCIYSWRDHLVEKQDSIIEGAPQKKVWTPGHLLTNATQLIFGAPSFIRFLTRL